MYLRPVHWIMDDGCLRLLEEEEGKGRGEMEEHGINKKKGEKKGGREREGKKEKEKKFDIKVDRNGQVRRKRAM